LRCYIDLISVTLARPPPSDANLPLTLIIPRSNQHLSLYIESRLSRVIHSVLRCSYCVKLYHFLHLQWLNVKGSPGKPCHSSLCRYTAVNFKRLLHSSRLSRGPCPLPRNLRTNEMRRVALIGASNVRMRYPCCLRNAGQNSAFPERR
jgi:hypothetical protein